MKKILVFIFIICAIGGGGYYVYESHLPFQQIVDTYIAKYLIDDAADSDSSATSQAQEDDVATKPSSRPPKRKTIPPGPYARIDKHAANAPKKVEASLEQLVSYLNQPANNEMEKVRSIFTWVAHNIRYDDQSYNSNTIEAMSAEEVISKKRAVCDGYSTLFQALCEEAGFECRKISGYSKGYGYSPGDQMTETDHAWNAIRVEKKWYLMDVTWASGYGVTKNGKLISVSEFDDYWFDVNPKEFIFTHMPEESKWQFIPHSLSLSKFAELPYVSKTFFKYGFKSDYVYTKSVNGAIKEFAKIYRTDYPLKIVKLPYANKLTEGSTYNMVVNSNFVEQMAVINNGTWQYFNKEGSTFNLQCEPKQGKLQISVKYHQTDPSFHTFVEYQVVKKQNVTAYNNGFGTMRGTSVL